MKLISLLFLTLLTLTTVNVFSQVEATTTDGLKVILNENGTWEYIENDKVTKPESEYDCSDLISTEIDKVTGISYTGSIEPIVISDYEGGTGFSILFVKGRNSVIISIQIVGAGNCINDDDKMNVLFRDGTRLELTNEIGFNCDGDFSLYFSGVFGKQRQLEMFGSIEVETMRIWISNSYVEKDFNSDQSIKFMKSVECIMN